MDKRLQAGARVTVKLDQTGIDENLRAYSGKVWSSKAPFREGTYWGYTVRIAKSMSEVFSQSPFKSDGKSKPYDLKIADSVNVGKDAELQGDSIDGIDFDSFSGFKHALLVVGGIDGLTGVLDNLNEKMTISQLREKIDACLITNPEQSSRTIRAEEGILMSLAQLMPHFRAVGKSDERKKRK